jgi:hypothetical protein
MPDDGFLFDGTPTLQGVTFVDFDSTAGYPEFEQRPLTLPGDDTGSFPVSLPLRGASDRLRTSSWSD